MKHTGSDMSYGRRKFLTSVTGLVGTSMAMTLPDISLYGNSGQTYTIKQVIDIIFKEIPGAPFTTTVDQ